VSAESGAGRRLWILFHESWKYLLASAVALALDYGLLVGLTEWFHVHYLASAAIGYVAGLVVTYGLSVTLVFRERRLTSRRLEFLGFAAIGLVALGLNEVVMKTFVEVLRFDYRLAKVPAAGIGFVFNFASRRLILFSKGRGASVGDA
jgi:putative flippase GtrA